MEKKFMPILRSATHYHNVNAAKISRDKHFQTAVAKVEDMKVVMGRNLNLLMERGENIDSGQQIHSCEKTRFFQREVLRMRNKCDEMHAYGNYSTCIVLVLISLVVVGFCGFGLEYCRSSGSNSEAAAANNDGGYSGGEKAGMEDKTTEGGQLICHMYPSQVHWAKFLSIQILCDTVL
jgi:hypothetical protein